MPSIVEWRKLVKAIDPSADTSKEGLISNMSTTAALAMKETQWQGNVYGYNSSGFTGVAGGYRSDNGTFNTIAANGFWWSSSIAFNTVGLNAYYFYLGSNTINQVMTYFNTPNYGFSVRLVKD